MARVDRSALKAALRDVFMPPEAGAIPVLGSGLYMVGNRLVDEDELFGAGGDHLFGMAGFANYDQIINAITVNGKGQQIHYNKTSFTSVAAKFYDLFLAAGLPAAGTFGTALTGRSMTSASAGALNYNNPVGPATMHLLSCGAGSTISLGTMILYDRIYEYPLNGTVLSGTFVVPTLVTRDVNGASAGLGQQMFVENFSATANTAVTLTLTYTNSVGTAGSTTAGVLVVSGTAGKDILNWNVNPYIPLAAGDFGARSIQSYTLSLTATSTQLCVVIARPLATVPVLGTNAYIERDTVLQISSLPRIYDSSCLALKLMANNTTTPVFGTVQLAEN